MAAGDSTVFRPDAFAEAQQVGELFRSGQVVEIWLDGVEEELARRFMDFSSGMVFVGGGTMTKVGPKRFRLEPSLPPVDRGRAGYRQPRNPRPVTGVGGVTLRPRSSG